MSSFTFADHKMGGRLTACCEAIGAGHLRKAAGIFNELAEELNLEAETTTGLLSEESEESEAEVGTASISPPQPEAPAPQLATASAPVDMQMCARNVHAYGQSDPVSGWRTCAVCGIVNVAPPENNGFVDMSERR